MAKTRTPAERRLMNKAVHYLGRYTASQSRLREVLGRFAVRKLAEHDPETVKQAMDQVVADCVRLGYVDDAAYAMVQARSKRRSGRSAMAIRRSLQMHSIDPELIDSALISADENLEDGDMAAALRYAARRRLGPYFKNELDEGAIRRQLGSFARAGFSLAIARQIMALNGPDAADEMANTLRR
jgi:regulatory protein